MTTFQLTDPRYLPSDISSLIPGAPAVTISGTNCIVHAELTENQVIEIKNAIASSQGIFEFRGVIVRSSVDVDNKVSADIKEAIAPGRPANLQGEAEKALLAKIGALSAKSALGIALTTEEQSYLTEKLTFYSTVVQPIRDEGDAFIAARGW